jgi:hypothetical protein
VRLERVELLAGAGLAEEECVRYWSAFERASDLDDHARTSAPFDAAESESIHDVGKLARFDLEVSEDLDSRRMLRRVQRAVNDHDLRQPVPFV